MRRGGAGETSSSTGNEVSNVRFRLIGINQDDRADGSGKAGLTFQAIKIYAMPTYRQRWDGSYKYKYEWDYSTVIDKSYWHYGWSDSLLRKDLNDKKSGRIWNSITSNDLKQSITPILKITKNNNNEKYGTKVLSSKTSNASSTTIDKLFILSPSEIGIEIVKDYNILDNDYQYNNANVHYYNNEQDSYINTLKTSNDSKGYLDSEYDYMYAGNTYEWFMLPSGSRKMKNNNQSYHNTDLYSYVTLADGYSMKPPSQNGSAALSNSPDEFWLRSPAVGIEFFSGFGCVTVGYSSLHSTMYGAGVVLAFAF